jgi:hypothetical protein
MASQRANPTHSRTTRGCRPERNTIAFCSWLDRLRGYAGSALALTALDLCEMGESMRRAQLHREHPRATDERSSLAGHLARDAPGPRRRCVGPLHLPGRRRVLSRAEAALRRIVADLETSAVGLRWSAAGGVSRGAAPLTRDAISRCSSTDDRDGESLVREPFRRAGGRSSQRSSRMSRERCSAERNRWRIRETGRAMSAVQDAR